MTYVIAQPCIDISDRACVEECPVDCIYEGERALSIHPDECVDCGACEPVCPVEAIVYEDDVPGQWSVFTADNAAFFTEVLPGPGPAPGRYVDGPGGAAVTAGRTAGRVPNVLPSLGPDPCGGVEIWADLERFSALSAYATTAVTALTAKNTHGVRAALQPRPTWSPRSSTGSASPSGSTSVEIGTLKVAGTVRGGAARGGWLDVGHRPQRRCDAGWPATSTEETR